MKRFASMLPVACVVATLCAAFAAPARAAEPASAPSAAPARTWAVVSLIGDQFTVVTRRNDTGTRLDPNDRRAVPVADPVFDRIAGAAAERALLGARPGSTVLQASIRDPRLFALQDKLLAESAESHDMRIALRQVLAKAGATDLVLVTKQRGEAAFRVADGKIGGGGGGTLAGIGFYLDNDTELRETSGRVAGGTGFLAPYAYVKVSILEIADMHLVKSSDSLESTMVLPAEKAGAFKAWDALAAQDKVEALDRIVRTSVDAGMKGLLSP